MQLHPHYIYMELAEKKELILAKYKLSFDKDIAYTAMELTDEEIEGLDNDAKFQARLSCILTAEKENIIRKLRGFMDQTDDVKIAFQATTDLGKILYPELFKKLTPDVRVKVSKDLTQEEEDRIAKEYGFLTGIKNGKKSNHSEAE